MKSVSVLPIGLALVTGVGCTGAIGDEPLERTADDATRSEGPADSVLRADDLLNSAACQNVNPGPTPLRRLSNAEYFNTVSDLFGKPALARQIVEGFSAETESLGFRNNAEFLPLSHVITEQFMDAADTLAQAAATDADFVKCTNPNNPGACAAQFIQDFGLRAYRRPLTSTELERFTSIFQAARQDYDFVTGVEWVVYTMLQSPNFLFRVETEQTTGNTAVQPTGYEMASRLSYLLWQSMPDATLFDAAARNELRTPAQILAQAERMVADPRIDRTLEFFRQWLGVDYLAEWTRDGRVFPGLPATMEDLFRGEVEAFVRHLLLDSNGTFADLVSAPYTFANAELAQHYGLQGGSGAEFEKIAHPYGAGFLTQAGFLTAHDKPTRTSIVMRGVKIRTGVMCELVPAPPNNVELDLDGLGEGLSQKERLALHRTEPACSGCHELIDPLGEIFESFDAVGRHRLEDDAGKPVDTRSQITKSVDLDGHIIDARDMGRKFAASDQVQQCYVAQNFRFFYGRDYTAADDCSRAKLVKAFVDSGLNLKGMLLALTQTDAFLYRSANN